MKDHCMLKLFIVEEKGKPVFRICPIFHPQGHLEEELGDFITGRKIGEEYIFWEVDDMREELDKIEKEAKDVIKKFRKTGIVKPTKIIPIGTKGAKGRVRKRGDINDLNDKWWR